MNIDWKVWFIPCMLLWLPLVLQEGANMADIYKPCNLLNFIVLDVIFYGQIVCPYIYNLYFNCCFCKKTTCHIDEIYQIQPVNALLFIYDLCIPLPAPSQRHHSEWQWQWSEAAHRFQFQTTSPKNKMKFTRNTVVKIYGYTLYSCVLGSTDFPLNII